LTVAAHDRSPILEQPRHIWYFCIPLAGITMIAYSIRNFINHIVEIRYSVSNGKADKQHTTTRHRGQSLQPRKE
ncbi:MAG: hypothetical protein JSW15_08625, partial [Deltaproteobacteria bacterium]